MEIRTMTTRDLDAALELWSGTEHLGPVPRDEVVALLGHDAELVLVAEAERRLATRGCVQVNLLVMADNDGGRRFWDGLGYASGGEVVLLARRLDGAGPGSC